MSAKIRTIVPIFDNNVFLSRQRIRSSLSYSGFYTLYYVLGDKEEALLAFNTGTMGLLPRNNSKKMYSIWLDEKEIEYIITPVEVPPRPREIFSMVASYFDTCRMSNTKSTNPKDIFNNSLSKDEYFDVPGCESRSFERDDLLIIDLHNWPNAPNNIKEKIFKQDINLLDKMASSLKKKVINKPLVEKVRVITNIRSLDEGNLSLLTQKIFDQKERHIHQVVILPCALHSNGEIMFFMTRERYGDKPLSFFSGRPLTRKNLNNLEDGMMQTIDYFNAANREYFEESMNVPAIIVPPRKEKCIIGTRNDNTRVVIWPMQILYEENLGVVYSRVANYVYGRRCLDNKGKMQGLCRESHVEKIDGMWLTKADTLKIIMDSNRVTGGITIFRLIYKQAIEAIN